LVNRVRNPEECDATGDAIKNYSWVYHLFVKQLYETIFR
jgi:hypothetical protein